MLLLLLLLLALLLVSWYGNGSAWPDQKAGVERELPRVLGPHKLKQVGQPIARAEVPHEGEQGGERGGNSAGEGALVLLLLVLVPGVRSVASLVAAPAPVLAS
jgi:hypothetical protein